MYTHTRAPDCALRAHCVRTASRATLRATLRAACAPQVSPMRTVYIGIREAGLASEFVRYKLRATALPRVLKDGMVIPTALPA